MPNIFTRVPPTPPPDLSVRRKWLIRIADVFMVAMWSRPSTGSFSKTWVTPGTVITTSGVAVMGLVCVVLIAFNGKTLPQLVVGLVILAVTLGAAAVGAVGVQQRRPVREKPKTPPTDQPTP